MYKVQDYITYLAINKQIFVQSYSFNTKIQASHINYCTSQLQCIEDCHHL